MSKKNREARRAAAQAENAEQVVDQTPAEQDAAGEVVASDTMTPEELAAERERLIAEAKAELEAPAAPAKPNRKPAVTTPTIRTPGGTAVNPDSIRQIIRRGLLAGETTKQIEATLKAKVPNSMAAAKAVKHIGYYRCLMRKAGELAPVKR